jgi:hypothetical protein
LVKSHFLLGKSYFFKWGKSQFLLEWNNVYEGTRHKTSIPWSSSCWGRCLRWTIHAGQYLDIYTYNH